VISHSPAIARRPLPSEMGKMEKARRTVNVDAIIRARDRAKVAEDGYFTHFSVAEIDRSAIRAT